MKKLVSGMMFTLLVLGTLTLTLNVQPAISSPATITVPDDYATIQAAINAANAGDTIYVRNGIYPEHIEVNKTVTLIGESNQNTIIEAHTVDSFHIGVHIGASNTIVENFRIVPPNSTDFKEIPTLVFIDGRTTPCSNGTIRNCVFVFATDVEAGADAIDIYSSANNTVTGNLITIADKTDAGIAVLVGSAGNLIDNNTITGGWEGITIDFADNNILSNNYITDQTPLSQPGFPLSSGAVYLSVTSGDTIKGNTLVNNTIAINPDNKVDNCLIYNNNFINNTQQALVGNTVTRIAWDNGYPSGGNYWSGYSGIDSYSGPNQNVPGSDKIGDQPYIIDANNTDHYPLMLPYGARAPYFSVETQNVTMGPGPAVGQYFTITVKLHNITSDNVPYGLAGVAVGLQWNNTLIEPTAFDDRIGQPGGVLVGSVIYGLTPGFYNKSGNRISSPPYTNATNFGVLAASTAGGWWGNGTVAVITFKVVYQPILPEPSASCGLSFVPGTGAGDTDLAEYTGSNAQEVGFDVENGSYTILPYAPNDTSPPITTLTIGEPKYVDPVSNVTYVTQYTPFTLEAYDNESGVSYTAYHIYNSTYDGGWQNYTTPFVLGPLKDGTYTIEFYSVDNAGNVEATNSVNVTLHWLYGDVNHDGRVSLSDLALVATAYRSRPGDPNWNQYADLAPPWGIISLTDLVTVAVHYGQTFHP